jgi:4-hydroxy-3-polyprenylbenzoate decarboxylase
MGQGLEVERMTAEGTPLVVGISGASGAVFGIELLRVLKDLGIPSHLVASAAAARTIALETDLSPPEAASLATVAHDDGDIAAAIASGSFRTRGMIVAPCSIKTLSAVANSYADTLLARAADVTLKERRPLVLLVRETPLHKGHLDLMARAADLGALILPPVPAFYHKPKTITDIVHQVLGKALDHVGIEHRLFERWRGA